MTFTPPAGAPRPLVISYWLYLVCAALGVIGLIVALAVLPAQLNALTSAQLPSTASGTTSLAAVKAASTVAAVVGAVLALAYAVVFVIFDRLMVRGRNWARIVLAVLTVLQIFGVGGAYGVGALHFLVGLAALILSFLPESNAYFRALSPRTAPPASV